MKSRVLPGSSNIKINPKEELQWQRLKNATYAVLNISFAPHAGKIAMSPHGSLPSTRKIAARYSSAV